MRSRLPESLRTTIEQRFSSQLASDIFEPSKPLSPEEELEARRSELRNRLTDRQRLFLFGKLSGLNDKDAAIAAGYSLSVAENTKQRILNSRVRSLSDCSAVKEWGTAMNKRKKPKTDAAPAIGDRLLTLREAADVLRLSTRTLREYVQHSKIEGRFVGGRWRFRRADLDAFFENAPRPETGTSVERIIRGIRRWSSGNGRADDISTSLARGRG